MSPSLVHTRPFVTALAATLALAGLLACSVKAPPRQAWSLSGGGPAGAPALDPAGPALGLARFTAAAEARTTTLTWRDADGQLVHETADTWVDYPDHMIEDMALARLGRSGKFRSVTMAPPHEGLTGVVACRLIEFGEWDAAGQREARVTLRWQLSGPDGLALGSGEARGVVPVAQETMSAVVAAHRGAANAALDSLIEQLLPALK